MSIELPKHEKAQIVSVVAELRCNANHQFSVDVTEGFPLGWDECHFCMRPKVRAIMKNPSIPHEEFIWK